jgi:DNA-binding response OmpR family regulator
MKNIVLIDDDDGEANQLTVQLGQFGYSVTHCSDANDSGMAELDAGAVALLVGLPAGDEAAPQIDQIGDVCQEFKRPPPLIFLSPDPNMATRLAAVRAGAAALLMRPVSIGRSVPRADHR